MELATFIPLFRSSISAVRTIKAFNEDRLGIILNRLGDVFIESATRSIELARANRSNTSTKNVHYAAALANLSNAYHIYRNESRRNQTLLLVFDSPNNVSRRLENYEKIPAVCTSYMAICKEIGDRHGVNEFYEIFLHDFDHYIEFRASLVNEQDFISGPAPRMRHNPDRTERERRKVRIEYNKKKEDIINIIQQMRALPLS